MSLFKLALFALLFIRATPLGAEAPLAVEVITARMVAESERLALTGELRAHDSLNAAFPAGGRISEITVDAGAKVAKGAVLARIESVQQEQALRAAEAGLLTARADFRQAQEDLDRQDTLLERGATTRTARDTAQDAFRIAEGVVGQAQADLERAHKALDDTVLTAPEEAVVTGRLAEPGQVVAAAQPVLELALGNGVDAVFDVPEVMLTQDTQPKEIELRLVGRPGPVFAGMIDEVSPVINPVTGAVTVKVAVTDPPPGLIYGESVRGYATHAVAAQVSLPYAAISATAAGPAVWRVDPATMAVSPIPVVIDRYETGRVLLASGVEDGMLIVGKGAQLLYPGRVVAAAEMRP